MKLNFRRLESIAHTLKAIENIETAIKWYADTSKVGPVRFSVKEPMGNQVIDMQSDRALFIEFLEMHKRQLIRHLEERFAGFEYDPNAAWTGDKQEEQF